MYMYALFIIIHQNTSCAELDVLGDLICTIFQDSMLLRSSHQIELRIKKGAG